VNYFEQGLRDGQSDRQTGASRSDHQQPNDPNDLRAYRDGYKQGFRDTGGRSD
jgi:predicted neuraminidase